MNKRVTMNEIEANELAKHLVETYADRAFEISMADAPSYTLMRGAFAKLGRETGPDGEFFVVKVFAVDQHAN